MCEPVAVILTLSSMARGPPVAVQRRFKISINPLSDELGARDTSAFAPTRKSLESSSTPKSPSLLPPKFRPPTPLRRPVPIAPTVRALPPGPGDESPPAQFVAGHGETPPPPSSAPRGESKPRPATCAIPNADRSCGSQDVGSAAPSRIRSDLEFAPVGRLGIKFPLLAVIH